jgi:alpha-ketoglutarate-dependent taurine dioxygenase
MPAYIIVLREGPVRDVAYTEYQRRNRAEPLAIRLKPLVAYGAIDVLEDGARRSEGAAYDSVIGMPSVNGRALLWRLQQWAAQPDFVYRHEWTVGDLVLWNNEGLMHRVMPYTDGRQTMHRTTINGGQRPGRKADAAAVARSLIPAG